MSQSDREDSLGKEIGEARSLSELYKLRDYLLCVGLNSSEAFVDGDKLSISFKHNGVSDGRGDSAEVELASSISALFSAIMRTTDDMIREISTTSGIKELIADQVLVPSRVISATFDVRSPDRTINERITLPIVGGVPFSTPDRVFGFTTPRHRTADIRHMFSITRESAASIDLPLRIFTGTPEDVEIELAISCRVGYRISELFFDELPEVSLAYRTVGDLVRKDCQIPEESRPEFVLRHVTVAGTFGANNMTVDVSPRTGSH